LSHIASNKKYVKYQLVLIDVLCVAQCMAVELKRFSFLPATAEIRLNGGCSYGGTGCDGRQASVIQLEVPDDVMR